MVKSHYVNQFIRSLQPFHVGRVEAYPYPGVTGLPHCNVSRMSKDMENHHLQLLPLRRWSYTCQIHILFTSWGDTQGKITLKAVPAACSSSSVPFSVRMSCHSPWQG